MDQYGIRETEGGTAKDYAFLKVMRITVKMNQPASEAKPTSH